MSNINLKSNSLFIDIQCLWKWNSLSIYEDENVCPSVLILCTTNVKDVAALITRHELCNDCKISSYSSYI